MCGHMCVCMCASVCVYVYVCMWFVFVCERAHGCVGAWVVQSGEERRMPDKECNGRREARDGMHRNNSFREKNGWGVSSCDSKKYWMRR
jgi:hypothetical protein